VGITLKEVSRWVNGELVGSEDTTIERLRSLDEAGSGDLTYVDGERNFTKWNSSQATAAIVPVNFPASDRPTIRVADPLGAFLQVLQRMLPPRTDPTGIDSTARIHPTVQLGEGAAVGPFCSIGESTVIGKNCRLFPGVVIGRHCRIADDVVLHPHVVLYDGCILGQRVIIHANAVIGADGFGYRFQNGRHERVPQLGHVEIGDDVEIGACSAIDRGTIGPTRIGTGTKIDNLVMIGHNCQIGNHNVFAGQVGVAGSSKTGDYVVMGGQVGVADHVTIGTGAMLAAQSGYTRDVEPGQRMTGSPGMPLREFFRCYANWPKIDDLRREVAALKKRLDRDGEA
jgi:UDP-3-O-[3-hydroxymyristoyl] glucosamine N-acyltransferase